MSMVMLTAKKLGSFLSLSNLLVTPVIQNTSFKGTFLRKSSVPTSENKWYHSLVHPERGRWTNGWKEGRDRGMDP